MVEKRNKNKISPKQKRVLSIRNNAINRMPNIF